MLLRACRTLSLPAAAQLCASDGFSAAGCMVACRLLALPSVLLMPSWLPLSIQCGGITPLGSWLLPLGLPARSTAVQEPQPSAGPWPSHRGRSRPAGRASPRDAAAGEWAAARGQQGLNAIDATSGLTCWRSTCCLPPPALQVCAPKKPCNCRATTLPAGEAAKHPGSGGQPVRPRHIRCGRRGGQQLPLKGQQQLQSSQHCKLGYMLPPFTHDASRLLPCVLACVADGD